MKVYPYEKGGGKKVLAMLKGGHTQFWGTRVVLTQELEVLALLKGGSQNISAL